MRGIPTNEKTLESHATTLAAKLKAYDTILAKQKYVAGDVSLVFLAWNSIAHRSSQEFSLVDIFHLPYGTMVGTLGYDFLESGEYPNVAR